MWRKRKKTPDGSGSVTPEEDDDIIDDESEKQEPGTTADDSVIPGSEPVTPSRRDSQLWKFLSTDRSTRRNAITDLCCYAEAGILELPDRFEDLSVNIGQSNNGAHDPNAPSTSKQG
ncbi:uncharacterized protein LOC144469108 isoform X2 [Augochlora pura]